MGLKRDLERDCRHPCYQPADSVEAWLSAVASSWGPGEVIGLGGLIVALASILIRSRERERDRRDHHRREAGQVVGPVIGFLIDADPLRVHLDSHGSEESLQQIDLLRDQWRNDIRPKLLALTVSLDSDEASAEARSVADHVDYALRTQRFYLRTTKMEDMTRHYGVSNQAHADAKEVAMEFAKLLRTRRRWKSVVRSRRELERRSDTTNQVGSAVEGPGDKSE